MYPGPILVIEGDPGVADIEQVIVPPAGANGLLLAAMGCQDTNGVQVAVGVELSWVDQDVASSWETSPYRIPLVRRRGATPLIDSFYFAGLAGTGEPLRLSSSSDSWMRLYLFVAASALAATDSVYVRIQWGLEKPC